MTKKEAIWYLTPIAESASLERYKEALGLALAAIRAQAEAEKNEPKGLYGKYIVHKAKDNTLVSDCFILRPEKDPAAVKALIEYAASTDDKALAVDILQWVGPEKNDLLTLDELREMDGEPVWVEGPEPGWVLVNVEEEALYDSNTDFIAFDDYGKTWLAYRRKPEEAMKNA